MVIKERGSEGEKRKSGGERGSVRRKRLIGRKEEVRVGRSRYGGKRKWSRKDEKREARGSVRGKRLLGRKEEVREERSG